MLRRRPSIRVFVPFTRGVRHNYHGGALSVKLAAKLLAKRTRNGEKIYTCRLEPREIEWFNSDYTGKMVPRYNIRDAIAHRLEDILLRKTKQKFAVLMSIHTLDGQTLLTVTPKLSS